MSRPMGYRRKMYMMLFNLRHVPRLSNLLTPRIMDQLDRCKDDASRRLLLGVSQVLRKEVS